MAECFLRKKEDEWPFKKSYSGTVLPDQLVMNIELETYRSSSISHIVDIKRFSDHYKLLRVTAIILAISKSKPFYMKSIVLTPKREMLKKAEVMGLIFAQEKVKKEIKPVKIKRLEVIKEDGVLVVGVVRYIGKLYLRRKESYINIIKATICKILQ